MKSSDVRKAGDQSICMYVHMWHKFQDTKISRKTEFLTEFLWCTFDLLRGLAASNATHHTVGDHLSFVSDCKCVTHFCEKNFFFKQPDDSHLNLITYVEVISKSRF